MENKKIIMYGAMWCPDTLRAITFFNQKQIEFEFKDIDSNPENTKFVEDTNNGLRIIPTIIFPDGTILTEPSNSEIERIIEK
jgi:glutaredoxin-related protein